MKRIGLIIAFMGFSLRVQAGPLDKFFDSLEGQTNFSKAGSFRDQAAGYYTGGGYALRQNNTVIHPINISLPSFGVGCNGLDMYFGSFSYLKTERLAELAQGVVTGIPLYGLKLSLKTLAPQVEGSMSSLLQQVQDVNALMMNSCHLSQQIVGGLWAKGTAASEQICMDLQNNKDWFGARGHCENPKAINAKVEQAREKYKDLLVGEYNLVHYVLKKLYGNERSKELLEFMMSVTGTLLSTKEGDGYRLKVIEPRADQRDFFSAYLKGGTTSMLSCNDNEKCLAPQIRELHLTNETAMKTKVIQKISDLRGKYASKDQITESDIHFLNDAVNVPVYRYIQVSVAAGTVFMMEDAAEYIAANILLAQFDRVMSEILEAIDALQKIQLEDTAIADFKKNLQEARGRVQAALIGVNSGSIHLLNQSIQAIEQAIIARNS